VPHGRPPPAALTLGRGRSAIWDCMWIVYQKADVHIQVPEGATPPKDGPSAGVGMAPHIISALHRWRCAPIRD